MEKKPEDMLEVEIREHSDADFFPEKCSSCGSEKITRKTYKIRTIQDLGTPTICRRVRYEKITFLCKNCNKTFTIKHPLIPPRTSYMPGVIKYATSRILKEGDSIRRVTKDLNLLHNVEVCVSNVKQWVDKAGKRNELNTSFSAVDPPEDFSGFISVDGTFKAATTKKNALKKTGKKQAKR